VGSQASTVRAAPSKTTRVDGDEPLTKRQKQILRCIADDLATKDIGVKLGISPRTVEFHKRTMKRTLGVAGIAGMVRCAIKSGLIAP